MRKVLVSGASGFIGSWVIDELLRKNYGVVAFDHHYKPNRYPGGVESIVGDMADATVVTEAAAHADGIIHLAGVLGTQETIKNPRPAATSNILGGLNFLEAANQYDLPMVYIAVGNFWMKNSYSISKTAVENYCGMFNNELNGCVNIVRAVNAYGPRQLAAAPFAEGKVRKITPSFVCRALCNMPIEIYGDGEQVSDMVYVGDLAETLVKALEAAENGNICEKVIECGPRINNTVNEVAAKVIEVTEALGLAEPGNTVTHLPMRPGEIAGARVTADISTLGQIGMDTDYFVGLGEGLRRTVKWFHENEGVTWTRP